MHALIDNFLYICVYVCICMCACAYVWVHVCVCICTDFLFTGADQNRISLVQLKIQLVPLRQLLPATHFMVPSAVFPGIFS